MDRRWQAMTMEDRETISGLSVTSRQGTYYIRVAAFARSTTGNYTLHVRFAGLPEDDHGDYEDNATAVAVPSTTRGELEHAADVDVFRFRLDSSGGRLTVETTGSTDVEGLLRGPNGLQERDDNSGAGSNFRIVVDDAPAGVYHAGVRGVGSGTGAYELHVRVDRAPSDDHGNDRASATRVGVPSDTSGALTPGDSDYFRIDISGSGTLEVYTRGSIDTVGLLEDADGSGLAENDDSGSGLNFRIERDVSRGTYYVRVRGVSGSTAGDYTLHVRFRREDDSLSDLTIHSFSIYLSNGDTPLGPVEPGSRLELAVAVRNIGRSASPPTVVDYYRSNDSRITSGDFRVGADNTVSLSSGKHSILPRLLQLLRIRERTTTVRVSIPCPERAIRATTARLVSVWKLDRHRSKTTTATAKAPLRRLRCPRLRGGNWSGRTM